MNRIGESMFKTSIIFGLAFMSFNLFAGQCPLLDGAYICREGSHVSYKEIKTTNEGYDIVSDGIFFQYKTDGKGYSVEATDSMKDGIVTSSCANQKFVVDFKATILYEGAEIAKQSTKSEYYVDQGQLKIKQKTKMKGIPLPTVNFICEKNE